MLSAFILSILSYPAMALAGQLVHQWYVHPGPLVLRTALFKFPTPTIDRDQTVSRRFEPSSRAALMGEQPNPWNLDSINNFAFFSARKRRRKQDNFVPHFYNLRENTMQMFFGAASGRMHAIPIIYDENFQAITIT